MKEGFCIFGQFCIVIHYLYAVLVRFIHIVILFLLFAGCSVHLSAQEKVYPKKGDGITTLLRRHNRVGTEYQKQFLEINKGKFGKGNSLLMGVAYVLPPATSKPAQGKGYERLFGSQLAHYDITSSELKGATFYLVGGHGGPDPGATARFENHTLHEDEYAYDIVLRLARNLMMKGAKVHIIIQDAVDGIRDGRLLSNSKRETCMGAPIPLGQTDRLKQRSDKINELDRKAGNGYSRAIFIHIDSRVKDKQVDVFFYHTSSAASKRLATTMKNTFASKYASHQPGRGFSGTISERKLYVLRNTNPVSIYAELGNMQNSFDLRRIIRWDNRQALAKWMCEAFVKDYEQYKAGR